MGAARYDTLPREVQRAIDRFFDSRESGLLVVVGSDADDPVLDEVEAFDSSTPLLSRLRGLERSLLDDLDLLARQHDEIDMYGEDHALQLRAEVRATLIALC